MTTYDVISELCKKQNLAITALERELGFGRGSIGKLRTGNTTLERLHKIADYFGVSVNYLTTGKDDVQSEKSSSNLTSRDNRDIAKDLESIMAKLNTQEAGSSFDGNDIPEDDRELFAAQLEAMLTQAQKNKQRIVQSKQK